MIPRLKIRVWSLVIVPQLIAEQCLETLLKKGTVTIRLTDRSGFLLNS